jgi:hypothetical protein
MGVVAGAALLYNYIEDAKTQTTKSTITSLSKAHRWTSSTSWANITINHCLRITCNTHRIKVYIQKLV